MSVRLAHTDTFQTKFQPSDSQPISVRRAHTHPFQPILMQEGIRHPQPTKKKSAAASLQTNKRNIKLEHGLAEKFQTDEHSVRVDLCILYFAHMLGAFLHIHLYMYYICGLWPPGNRCICYCPNMVSEKV